MANCWKRKAEERPKFSALVCQLGEVYQQCSLSAALQTAGTGVPPRPVTPSNAVIRPTINISQANGPYPSIALTRSSPDGAASNSPEVVKVHHMSSRQQKSRDGHGHQHSKTSRSSRDGLGLAPDQLSLTFSVLSGDSASESEEEEANEGGEATPTANYRGGVTRLPLLSSATDAFEPRPGAIVESHAMAAPWRHSAATKPLPQRTPHDETSFTSLVSPTAIPNGRAPDGSGGGGGGGGGSLQHKKRSDIQVDGSTSTLISSSSGQQFDNSSTPQLPPPPSLRSPSPGLTSKSSTLCDERLSVETSSSILPPLSINGGGMLLTLDGAREKRDSDTISKTSTVDLDSVSTSMSVPYPSCSSSQTSGMGSLPGHYGGGGGGPGEEESRRDTSLLLPPPPHHHHHQLGTGGKGAWSTDSGVRSSDEEGESARSSPLKTSHCLRLANNNGALAGRDGYPRLSVSTSSRANSQPDSHLSCRSDTDPELELSDLSSDILSVFDKW